MTDKASDDNDENEAPATSSSVSFGNGAQITGNVAGRDIIVTSSGFEDKADELVAILELRAENIQKSLAKFYKYAPVQVYLAKFRELHSRHMQTLRNKQLLLAHEFLAEIHRLSFELEREEFWTRHKIETPYNRYMLSHDAFQRGNLICEYVAGEMRSYSEKYPSSRGYGRGLDFFDESESSQQKDVILAVETYTIIIQSSTRDGQDHPEIL